MAKRGPIEVRQGANLPHWTSDGATYAVTFRLADSLPRHAMQNLRTDMDRIERKFDQAESLGLEEAMRRSKAKEAIFLKTLDEGHGECLLQRPEIAQVVGDALKHFDGERYRIFAWCVMPNHVHVVVQPLGGMTLSRILHSWKSFTAHRAGDLLGRSGLFWQHESYDHLIRDAIDFEHHVRYVRENPVAAGLRGWVWVG